MTLMITSKPLDSDFPYLKFHMPSFSLFQNAPEAECMPFLPAGRPSSSDAAERVSRPCWMIVLLTANLYKGCWPDGAVSAIRV